MHAYVLRTRITPNHTAYQQVGAGMRSSGQGQIISKRLGFYRLLLHFRFHWIFSLDFLSIYSLEKVIMNTQSRSKI